MVAYLIGQLSPHVFQAVEHSALHPRLEASNAVERLGQLVGVAVRGRRRKVGGAEAAQ